VIELVPLVDSYNFNARSQKGQLLLILLTKIFFLRNKMSQIEQLQDAIKQLTGAVNLQHEMIKNINQKLKNFEDSASSMRKESSTLSIPTSEQDLKEIAKLPDCVKELQVFDGNPAQYVFWVHTVESILADYSIVKDKPIYRAILQNIRQRIRGQANSALISYNIFDGSWDTIKKCIMQTKET